MKRIIYFSLFLASINIAAAQKPLMKNQPLIDEINYTLDLIYNFEFQAAEDSILSMRKRIGDHPGLHFLDAMVIYWRDRPLAEDSEIYLKYESELNKAIQLSEPFLKNDDLYIEGVFYKLCGYGFLTDLYSEAGGSMKVVSYARSAYKYLKKGFEMEDEFPDFLFTTGLYNYYREKYPELYPFYKSFVWLFADGNLDLGIEYLTQATEKGLFTKREAYIYLFHIYQRYENQPSKAYPSVEYLFNKYPGNLRFRFYYIENLFALDSLHSIDTLLNEIKMPQKDFYRLSLSLFQSMMLEKNGEMQEAKIGYLGTLSISEFMEKKYPHYLSMTYAGLARVSDKQAKTEDAKYYYKKALDLDPYIPIKEEAMDYLQLYED